MPATKFINWALFVSDLKASEIGCKNGRFSSKYGLQYKIFPLVTVQYAQATL